MGGQVDNDGGKVSTRNRSPAPHLNRRRRHWMGTMTEVEVPEKKIQTRSPMTQLKLDVNGDRHAMESFI